MISGDLLLAIIIIIILLIFESMKVFIRQILRPFLLKLMEESQPVLVMRSH